MKRIEKKSRVETRKHKAVRRTLLCLAAVTVFSALHLYTFTPMQAVRQAEGQMGTGTTSLIRRMNGDKWDQIYYLTANEHAILVTRLDFHLLYGWFGLPMHTIDCSDLGDFQAKATMGWTSDEGVARWTIFGRLQSQEVTGIQAQFRFEYRDEKTGGYVELPEITVSDISEFTTARDGRRYFIAQGVISGVEHGEYGSGLYPLEMAAATLDAQGNILAQYRQTDYNMEMISEEE